MKNFIKIWWHCLWRMWSGHRMCQVEYFNGKKEWFCSHELEQDYQMIMSELED